MNEKELILDFLEWFEKEFEFTPETTSDASKAVFIAQKENIHYYLKQKNTKETDMYFWTETIA